MGGRLALVREAVGITAYHAGEWAEAMTELRAARRIGGDNSLLHVIADCERALGRPERALAIARGPEVAALSEEVQVEMAIVEAGARRDMGQFGAAVLALQGPRLSAPAEEWTVRLWYAYADALAAAGRVDDAAHWFTMTRDIDDGVTTDAADRLAAIATSP
jgi:tetratricopeptide (TPR) repeat protein